MRNGTGLVGESIVIGAATPPLTHMDAAPGYTRNLAMYTQHTDTRPVEADIAGSPWPAQVAAAEQQVIVDPYVAAKDAETAAWDKYQGALEQVARLEAGHLEAYRASSHPTDLAYIKTLESLTEARNARDAASARHVAAIAARQLLEHPQAL